VPVLVFLRSVRQLLVTASVVPSSQSLVTLMMEALSSSETSVLTRATPRKIPGDAILQFSVGWRLLLVAAIGAHWNQQQTVPYIGTKFPLYARRVPRRSLRGY
jgi:hypothetical protein